MFRVSFTATNGSGRGKSVSPLPSRLTLWLLSVVGGTALFTSVMAQTLADAAPHHAQRILSGLTRPDNTDCPSMRKVVAKEIEKPQPVNDTAAKAAEAVPSPKAAPPTAEANEEMAKERVFACPIRDQGFDQLLWRQDGNQVFPRGCL